MFRGLLHLRSVTHTFTLADGCRQCSRSLPNGSSVKRAKPDSWGFLTPILWFSVLRNSSTVVEPSKPTTYVRKQRARLIVFAKKHQKPNPAAVSVVLDPAVPIQTVPPISTKSYQQMQIRRKQACCSCSRYQGDDKPRSRKSSLSNWSMSLKVYWSKNTSQLLWFYNKYFIVCRDDLKVKTRKTAFRFKSNLPWMSACTYFIGKCSAFHMMLHCMPAKAKPGFLLAGYDYTICSFVTAVLFKFAIFVLYTLSSQCLFRWLV